MAALIVFAGRAAFQYPLVYPPLVACLVAFGAAGMLGLLRRSLVASARLDANIAELAVSGDLLAPAGPGIPGAVSLGGRRAGHFARGWLPKGVEWKARTLSELNARLLDRAKFVELRAALGGRRPAHRRSGRRDHFRQPQRGRNARSAAARPGGSEPAPSGCTGPVDAATLAATGG